MSLNQPIKTYQGDAWNDFPHHNYKGITGDTLLNNGQDEQNASKNNNVSLNTGQRVSLEKSIESDPFWLQQPSILVARHRLSEFYPDSDLSVDEQLNAITRMIIYLGVLLFIVSGQLSSFFLVAVGMAAVVFIQEHGRSLLDRRQENFISAYRRERLLPNDYPIRVSNRGEVCQAPTRENPFMNVLLSDYAQNPARPAACDLADPAVREQVKDIFNDRLYLDIDDIWEKRNSQRQFVTQPNTQIPNDRETFAKWCYDTRNHSCRENYICKNDLSFDQTGPLPSAVFRNM